ncbi:tail fiber protein [Cytophagales bacterium LB-30]|uniref:Tail fiber protein n=1 Tax=Shiella aurantiaca TaxID=3058365 RepID=A0ABT8F9K0_9BACT|nr:tail fiber protein [Shiella aurantiaca]MDN4167075.1 tail fiber protein [Shiella aurantiaca]
MDRISLIILALLFSVVAKAQFITLGSANGPAPDYAFSYYKLFDLNGFTGDASALFRIAILADDNYLNHAEYHLWVSKHSGTVNRVDGVALQFISGKPQMLEVIATETAVWIRAMGKWGTIRYENPINIGISQSGGAGWVISNQAAYQEPTGYTIKSKNSFYYDYDNAKLYEYPSYNIDGSQITNTRIKTPGSGYQPSSGLNHSFTLSATNTNGILNMGVDGTGQINPNFYSWLQSTHNNGNYFYALSLNPLGGNVGIGTTQPDATLTVKGDIHAREVRVDLNGAVAPDYVFEPDYSLMSLQELSDYLKEHKHLPEVPSAKEMEQNGVNLLEMNLLLLKKVEELTLHVIELERKCEELEVGLKSTN